MDVAKPSREAVRMEVARIGASAEFKNTPRLREFLQFITDEALAGREEQIKEYSIGISVYRRDTSYDPRLDSTVRVEASKLRSRLGLYYERSGEDDPVRVSVPKGGYVPQFENVAACAPQLTEILGNRALEKDPGLRDQAAREPLADLSRLTRTRTTGSEQVSIVVLPFENLSPDPEDAFFTDGLTDELIGELSKVRSLRVISRTTAMLFKGARKSVPAIAQEVNVRYAMEGTVRRSGASVRITAQLIDAASDTLLWAECYSGTLDDVFDLQERLARRIVEALKVTLTTDEERRLAIQQIPHPRAFDCYLRGRQEMYKCTEGGLDRALELTNQALEIAGPNAWLYAMLSEVYFLYRDMGIRRDEQTLEGIGFWTAKALELSPECAPGLAMKGVIEWKRGDMPGAIRSFRQAVELGAGGDTSALLGYVCAQVGTMTEARRYAARAISVDPGLWLCRVVLAAVTLMDGDLDGALLPLRGAGIGPIEKMWLGILAAYAGRRDEAIRVLGEVGGAGAGGISAMCAAFGAVLQRDPEGFRRVLADSPLLELAKQDKEFLWWLADGFACIGDTGEALRLLEKAIDLGFTNHRLWSEVDPFLTPLGSDRRFQALMNKARDKQRESEG
jgi:TolB-like protein